MVQIADALSKKIDHSEESIRDRIRKCLILLRQVDVVLIEDEAKVDLSSLLELRSRKTSPFLLFIHLLTILEKSCLLCSLH